MKVPETLNLHFLDSPYRQYQADPESVDIDWRIFSHGFDIGFQRNAPANVPRQDVHDGRITALIDRYRDPGQLLACMDPLTACPTAHPLSEPERPGFFPLENHRGPELNQERACP